MKENITNTIETLNYYKDVLQTDFYLPYFFQDSSRVDTENENHMSQQFLFYALNNYNKNKDQGKYFETIIKNLIAKKPFETIPSSILNLYYSPIMIIYKFNESEKFFISPFFIELEITDMQKPLELVNEIINFFTDDNDENYNKNIFKNAQVILNPAMLVEPFELLDTNFFERVNNARESVSKTMNIDSMKNLFEVIIELIKQLNLDTTLLKDSISLKKLFMKEARMVFNQELLKFLDNLKVEKDISMLDDGFIFIKNNTIDSVDDAVINGLMNVYNKIKENPLSEDNLLNFVLTGNKYKYCSSYYKDILEDSSTVFVTPKVNNSLTLKHLGAMSSKNDLTSSQKYCLNITNTHLPIIPVNGPPGTGKTSLLRAIVGDIVVKNAIGYARQYFLKKDIFDFKTPIVSFSTNNRALDNIIEGIVSAFDEIEEILPENLKPLANRWINPDYEFVYFDNSEPKKEDRRKILEGTINNLRLFVPKIKNSQEYINTNPNYPIFGSSLSKFSAIVETVKSRPEYFIIEYIKQFNKIFNKFDNLEIVSNRLEVFLDIVIQTLHKEILKNDELMLLKNNELKHWVNSKQLIENEINEICSSLNINFKDITTKKEFDLFVNVVRDNLSYLKEISINHERILEQINNEKSKSLENLKKVFAQKELAFNKELQVNIDNIIQDLENKKKTINDNKLAALNENSHLHSEKLVYFEKLYNNKNIFVRTFEKLFGKYNEAVKQIQDERDSDADNINKIYEAQDAEVELSSSSIIENTRNLYTILLESEKKSLSDSINQTTITYSNMVAELLLTLKDKMYGYDKNFKNIEEFKNKVCSIENKIDNLCSSNKFFYDEYESKVTSIYKGIDKEIRTMSYLYAQHLQEAFLLFELLRLSKNKNYTQKCFKCRTVDSVKCTTNDKGNDIFKCSSQECDFIFVNNNSTFSNRKLFNYEIIELFEMGSFNNNGKSYTLQQSSDKKFWNVTLLGLLKNDKSFNYLSVFFPIVNTTCHSFGTTMPLEEKCIDYMFIDEAGMVLVPYMVNLYAGKKVFVFGDEKQIKPVYPLNIPSKSRKNIKYKTIDVDNDNPTCIILKQNEINSYLIRKNIKNVDTKVKVLEFQNVLSSSIMSLANRSVYIKNDFIKRDEIGDLWLTEHFRCRKDIIDYCNEHIYNNMMITMKPNANDKNHLSIIDHDFNQKTHPSGSKYNTEEADLIIQDILLRIKNMTEDEKDEYTKNIGVISPYKAQANEIMKQAKNNGLKNVVSGTVHKFQGSERNIIYVSTTIGINDNVSYAFFNNIEEPNIINVAISRAKEEIIIVGNIGKLSEDSNSLTGKLISHIRKTSNI